MKRLLYLLMLCCVLALNACTKANSEETTKEWTREGYFQDADENFLSVQYFSDMEGFEDGWYVGAIIGDDSYGNTVAQEGNDLHGNIGGDEEFIVTVSEEGTDGLKVVVEGGDTYHFTAVDMPEATIFVSINTEGYGNIEYAEGDVAPEIDTEYPYQSAQVNLAEPTVYSFVAWPNTGWNFVKWTKDGEDFSTDEAMTFEITESCDLVAVFEKDEDWVNPLLDYDGNYQADRATAMVQSMAEEGGFVIIDWADSAETLARWTIYGVLDTETLTLQYEGSSKEILTFNEGGEVTETITEYEDGTGYILFNSDSLGFVWHDDQSEGEDLAFEWVSPLE